MVYIAYIMRAFPVNLSDLLLLPLLRPLTCRALGRGPKDKRVNVQTRECSTTTYLNGPQ